MAAEMNKAPKGEDPSGLRGCDRKEEKETAPVAVKWGGQEWDNCLLLYCRAESEVEGRDEGGEGGGTGGGGAP